MGISYQVEAVTNLIEEIKPLLQSHYEEIARHKDKIKLNPDYDKYIELDRIGLVHVVTARDEGSLVGYFISFVISHLHYKDHIMSTNDILYISPSHRKGTTALKLIRFTESTLKSRGVTKILINMKLAHDFSSLLERMGYVEIERVYEKMLI
jgi:GNAT superfamily N-acetyltransferase